MFKGDKAYSFDSVKQDLRTYWSLDVNDGDGDDEAAVFEVNGKRIVLASMPHPIPEGELDSLYDYNYMLKDAGKEIKEHTQHAIVSVMPTDSSIVEQYILLTKVIASILRTSQNALLVCIMGILLFCCLKIFILMSLRGFSRIRFLFLYGYILEL